MPKPNAEKPDPENPILSDAEIAAMRPVREVLGEEFVRRQLASRDRAASQRSGGAYRYEIYRDQAGAFRVRFRTPSGEVLFATEGFSSRGSAVNAIRAIQGAAGSNNIEDVKDGLHR